MGLDPKLWESAGLSGKFIPSQERSGGTVLEQVSQCETLPPAHLRHFYGYRDGFPDNSLYLSGGASDAAKLFHALHDAQPGARFQNILDFGCSAGRVCRHFPKHSEGLIWGCDIHAEAIHWAKQNLRGPFRFFTNTTAPHLPFTDESFDLIFAGSIFTHMDELYTAWLLELKRCLTPEGRLAISFSHQGTQRYLLQRLPQHPSHAHLASLKPRYRHAHSKVNENPWSTRLLFDRNAFLQELADLFSIERVQEHGYGWQCLVILKKF